MSVTYLKNYSIRELIINASQLYGAYKAHPSENSTNEYNHYIDEILERLGQNSVDVTQKIREHALEHSKQLEIHVHYKYGYDEKRHTYGCQRDLLAISWLKSMSKDNYQLRHLGPPPNLSIQSNEMKKILSRGIPLTNDEWLEAVCQTDDIDVRDLLRLKFGPEFFPQGFAEKFQVPYKYELIDVITDIITMFPELKKFCSNFD